MQLRFSRRVFAGLLIVAGCLCLAMLSVSPAYAGSSAMLKLKISDCQNGPGDWLVGAKVRVEVYTSNIVADEYTGTTDSDGYVEFEIENLRHNDQVYVHVTPFSQSDEYQFVHIYDYFIVGIKRAGAWSLGSTGGGSLMLDECEDRWFNELDGIIHAIAKDEILD